MKCKITKCDKEVKHRELCLQCYQAVARLVHVGMWTWETVPTGTTVETAPVLSVFEKWRMEFDKKYNIGGIND